MKYTMVYDVKIDKKVQDTDTCIRQSSKRARDQWQGLAVPCLSAVPVLLLRQQRVVRTLGIPAAQGAADAAFTSMQTHEGSLRTVPAAASVPFATHLTAGNTHTSSSCTTPSAAPTALGP